MEDIPAIRIICFWATTSTEENNLLKAFHYYWPIKSNILKTSSFSEAITNAHRLIEFTGFMINVKFYLILGKRKYNLKLWKLFSDVFNVMPVCALVDEKIMCMHGGLSPQLENL